MELHVYQQHLDRVSRSFALCIQQLTEPLRGWTSLSYLLCRVLDTVEDSKWLSIADRDLQYCELDAFARQCPTESSYQAWAARFPNSISDGERELIQQGYGFFVDLHQLDTGPRDAICDTLQRMGAGMRRYSTLQDPDGSLRLTTLQDVNRYCYFVAGIVGELLTRLFMLYRRDFSPDEQLFKNALHFGLFLQKVNILKDQRSDELEGRFLVPDRTQVFHSLREHAQGSLQYLMALPVEEVQYRTFCGWSLFLGAASLPWIEDAYVQNQSITIPRNITLQLLQDVAGIVQDNAQLRTRLQPLLQSIPAPPPMAADALSLPDWFRDLCSPSLPLPDMRELGLV